MWNLNIFVKYFHALKIVRALMEFSGPMILGSKTNQLKASLTVYGI